MKLFRKIFCETEISWKLLLVYSVVTGVVVGLINCVPFLEDTSFVYPAVTYEYWFVAAIFIIANCKSAVESMIKTFVFFLISQPLIYLVEVPFKEAGWELFGYYKFWAYVTVLTIPGAFIAYQIKRDNILSSIVLSVATGYLSGTGIIIAKDVIKNFPKGLVAVVFCLAFSVILIQTILQNNKSRIAAYFCTLIIAAALVAVVLITSGKASAGITLDETHEWKVVESSVDSNVEAEVNGSYLNVECSKKGNYTVILENEKGDQVKYEIEFGDRLSIKEAE